MRRPRLRPDDQPRPSAGHALGRRRRLAHDAGPRAALCRQDQREKYGRTGTLWEGRYKACLVDTQDYLLRCYRYIELNPVRAAMVASPAAYRWSSHPCNAYGVDDPLVAPHAEYLALGPDAARRRVTYLELFAQAMPDERIVEIRAYLRQQRVLGSERFQAGIEAMLGRRAALRPLGRPRKGSGSGEI